MRIAQISTLAAPVHPDRGGSIEQLVWFLSRELTRLGHEVTVFGCAGSEPVGKLVASVPGAYGLNGAPGDWYVCEWMNLCRAVAESANFDVMHSHAYLWGVPLDGMSSCPIIHTMHTMPGTDSARLWANSPSARVTAISRYQWSQFPDLQPVGAVYHGVDPSNVPFQPEPQDYICFLGRFSPEKGPLEAIHAARQLGLRLVLAGPANDYYREHIEPLVDGDMIQYGGWVSGSRRYELLAGARALLYPIRKAEPFGLVLPEAMMCGTPVAAMRLGAVEEIVDEGQTGFTTDVMHEYPETVQRTLDIDRAKVRARAIERFSAERMALDYLRLYQQAAASFPEGSNASKAQCESR
jgi:glycosyltransferase involved in cell wall biosynthesis